MQVTGFGSARYMLAHSGKVCALLFAFSCLQPVSSNTGSVFDLVTLEEYSLALSKGERPQNQLTTKSLPGIGPEIVLERPDQLGSKLNSPVDILLRFSTSDGASIDMQSLRISYGYFLRIDITDRILEHAELGESHLEARGAKLPSGKHEIFIEISDENGRKTEKEYSIRII